MQGAAPRVAGVGEPVVSFKEQREQVKLRIGVMLPVHMREHWDEQGFEEHTFAGCLLDAITQVVGEHEQFCGNAERTNEATPR